MGITCSEQITCGCDDSETTDKTSRQRKPNMASQPPSNPKIYSNSEELLLSNEPSHGLSQEVMNVKTMELLLKFDDSFSPTTKKKLSHLSFEDTDTMHFIPTINESDENKHSENITENINTENDIPILTENDMQTVQPAMRKLTTDEKDIAPTNDRLLDIQKLSNIFELEDTIRTHYDTSHSDSNSSMDEAEIAEIKRIKSISDQKVTKIKMNKSNVFRQDTANPWDEDDIEDLHDEMSQQFLNLSKQASDVEISNLNSSGKLSQQIYGPSKIENNGNVELPRAGGLYRDASNQKWNKPLIDKEKDEMRKQMMYLAKQNINKNAANNDNDEDIVQSDESDINDEVQYVNHLDMI